jgi:DNA-directed RNA polymerase specialized sigma24 family protein
VPPKPHPASTLLRRAPLSPDGELRAVKRARDRLALREAAAVAAGRGAGMSWPDVAEAVGLPLTTVHRRYR